MLLVAATQPVVARKAHMPLTLPLTLFERHRPSTRTRTQTAREPVPAKCALGIASGTWVLPKDRRTQAMPVMPTILLHQRRHQPPHWSQIHSAALVHCANDVI